MAGSSDDPYDFSLSMRDFHIRGKFTEVTPKHNRARLCSNKESVTIKVGGRTTDNQIHGEIMYLDQNLSNKSITTSEICSNSDQYSVCVNEDKLIISGGYNSELKKSVSDIHQFCVTSKKWEVLHAMPKPRDSHSSTCINHLLVIVAGCYREHYETIKAHCQEVYTLNLHSGIWTAKKQLPIVVIWASIAVVNGDLFLLGGAIGDETSKKMYKFSLENYEWTRCADFIAAVSGLIAVDSTVAVEQKIYVLSFQGFLCFDVQLNQWSTLSAPLIPSHWCSLIYRQNSLIAMGGFEDDYKDSHNRIQCYDLSKKEWCVIPDTLPLPLSHHTVFVMELPWHGLFWTRPLTVAPNQGMAYRQSHPGATGPHYGNPYPDDDDEFYPAEDMPPPQAVNAPMARAPHPTHRSLMRQPRIRGSAENLVGKVLEEHGLSQVVDPSCIRRELAEATDMTEEELDAAAHELMQAREDNNPPKRFYEHPGGYSMHEMHDYNKYPPGGSVSQHGSPAKRPGAGPYHPDEVDDDMVYVTTL